MTFYAVDSARQVMRSTGIVNEVREWVDGPEGKRRPSQLQARDENTGMLLWDVEVLYRQVAFGRESNATGMVRVGAPVKTGAGRVRPGLLRRVERRGAGDKGWRAVRDVARGWRGGAGRPRWREGRLMSSHGTPGSEGRAVAGTVLGWPAQGAGDFAELAWVVARTLSVGSSVHAVTVRAGRFGPVRRG